MSEPEPRRIGRSIVAGLAGIVAVVLLSIGTDALMRVTGIFPASGQPMADGLFMLAAAYRTVYGIISGVITAALAPRRPMAHALAVGFLGLVVGAAGAAANWNRGPEFGPHWYPIVIAVLAPVNAWIGATLASKPKVKGIAA